MSGGFELIDNSAEILRILFDSGQKGLEKIGIKAENYAKKLVPVGTVESVGGWAKKNKNGKRTYRGGTLKRSITHRVDGDELIVGSNVEYAPYVELGTGPNFRPPPEWIDFTSERGKGVGKAYVKPRPFLRPAFEDHRKEYQDIMERELRG